MNKQEFLLKLRKGLSGLPKEDIEERLGFYGEMIDDRIEEGLSEEAAVSDIGSVDSLIEQIIADTPLTRLVKEKIRPKKKPKALEIVLLILGSPVWLSVLVALLAVILTLYVVLWSVIFALWAVFASLAACGFACTAAGIVFAARGNTLTGIAVFGAGLFCFGLTVFSFFGCRAATKGLLGLTKKLAIAIKNSFVKKEEA